MSDNPTADFLNEAASEGVTASELNALGGASSGSSAATASPGAGSIDSLDSNGLPEAPGAAGLTPPSSPLLASLPPNATPAQVEAAAMQAYNSDPALQQYISQTYGYIGAYLLSVPELLPILVAAGLNNWGQAEFDGAITQTTWWKTTSQAQRNFQEIQATDPGEAASQIAQEQDTILGQAQSLGVSIPPDQLKNLAQMAVAFGWSTDVITQTLRAGGAYSTANPSFGAAATFSDQASQLAGEYNINVSPTQMAAYVNQNVAGTLTADGLQQEFMKQAEQQNPWMASSIAMGVTPSQYLSTYSSAAGTTLGIDPSDVNWTDPKWNQALLQTVNGAQQPVSVGQFQQNLMKNPLYGYQNTQGARDQAYSAAQQVLSTFGKVAT